MNKHSSDKVIPTLDDVIQRGKTGDTSVGDLKPLEDDIADDIDRFFLEDDEAQASKYLDKTTDAATLAEIEINAGSSQTHLDLTDDITDQIMAERFPSEDHNRQEPTPALTSLKDLTENPTVQKQIVTDTPATQAQTISPEPAPEPSNESKPTIVIGELVDEITRQLMPEIEWKIRTRVREVLEQHFPDND